MKTTQETDKQETDKQEVTSKNEAQSESLEVPDGGWGWVVTFSSFFVSFFVDGIGFTFGIFLPEFLRYFGGSKGKTSMILSVFVGSYLTFGKRCCI